MNVPPSKRKGLTTAATTQAKITGNKLRGLSSKSNNSTANSTAAVGVPNVAVMPPAAPATSSVLRSADVNRNTWAMIEPKAPPVMMIGPSAPNGPPEPIEIADASGLSTATLGDMRLRPMRIASRASGNAVAANAVGTIARQKADNQPADNGDGNRRQAEAHCPRGCCSRTTIDGSKKGW